MNLPTTCSFRFIRLLQSPYFYYQQICGNSVLRQYRANSRCGNLVNIRQRFASSDARLPLGTEKRESGSTKVPMTWLSFALFSVIGGAGIYYVTKLKDKKEKEIQESLEQYKGSVGKALIGGPWELVNFDNQLVSWRDYVGKWVIIYFGFTHCPDICPEELEKLCNVIEHLKKDQSVPKVYPLFFTVDPYRDTPSKIKKYCLEYSPELVGFSGSVEQVSKVCKMFRVYFSEGPKTDEDYIVDHSIIMYLMNPDGEYVEHYSRETSEKRMLTRVKKQIQAYEMDKNS